MARHVLTLILLFCGLLAQSHTSSKIPIPSPGDNKNNHFHDEVSLNHDFDKSAQVIVLVDPNRNIRYSCPPCGCAHDDTFFDEPGHCPICQMKLIKIEGGIKSSIAEWIEPLFMDGTLGVFYPKLIYPIYISSILFAVLLLVNRTRGRSLNIYLTGLILVVALYGFKNQIFGVQNSLTCLCQGLFVPISFIVAMGPLAYFYVKSTINPRFRFSRRVLLHFSPAITIFLMYAVILILPGSFHSNFMSSPFEVSFSHFEQVFTILAGLIYIRSAHLELSKWKKKQVNNEWTFFWMRRFLNGVALALIIWLVLIALNYWLYDFGVATLTYNILWISFALILAWLGVEVMSNPKFFLLPSNSIHTSKNWTAEEIQTYRQKLDQAMREQRLYTDPELNLEKLANVLETNSKYMSNILNYAVGKSFYEYINYYRVEEVKQLLKSPESKDYTIEAVANQAGFKSKSSFNLAFKKITNMTPREFMRKS